MTVARVDRSDYLEHDNQTVIQKMGVDKAIFPESLIELWIEKKKADFNKVNSIPHPAEFTLYYDL